MWIGDDLHRDVLLRGRNTFWLAKRTMDARFKMATMSSSNATAGNAGANIRMNSLREIVVDLLGNEPIAINGS